jgi:hypothetical protein
VLKYFLDSELVVDGLCNDLRGHKHKLRSNVQLRADLYPMNLIYGSCIVLLTLCTFSAILCSFMYSFYVMCIAVGPIVVDLHWKIYVAEWRLSYLNSGRFLSKDFDYVLDHA